MSPLSSAANALFTMPSSGSGKRAIDADADGGDKKRQSLRRYEHIGPMVLQNNGASPIHECTNKQLWAFASQGNKGVEFFSEFCASDDYRRGIAGSRHAETMIAFGEVLKESVFEQIMQTPILEKVRAEFDQYMPMLEVLNGGKTSQANSKSFMTMCKKTIKKDKVLSLIHI